MIDDPWIHTLHAARVSLVAQIAAVWPIVDMISRIEGCCRIPDVCRAFGVPAQFDYSPLSMRPRESSTWGSLERGERRDC